MVDRTDFGELRELTGQRLIEFLNTDLDLGFMYASKYRRADRCSRLHYCPVRYKTTHDEMIVSVCAKKDGNDTVHPAIASGLA